MIEKDSSEQLVLPNFPFAIELKEAIGCPVDWRAISPIAGRPALANDLRTHWMQVAENLQVDDEMRWYLLHELEGFPMNHQRLKVIQTNAATWREQAVARYISEVGFLRNLHFLSWDKYPKHRPPPGKTRDQILNLTKGPIAASLFFHVDTIPLCETLLWEAISDDLVNIITSRPDHVYVRSIRELGACQGQASDVMRIDLDYSNCQAHGHPRPVPAGEKLLGVSYGGRDSTQENYQVYYYTIDDLL